MAMDTTTNSWFSYETVPSTSRLLSDVFSYHAPKGDQQDRYVKIREAAKAFALVVLENTPKSADQTDAIRKIREAVMVANASIALEP